jgi:hypothetical protein
VSVLVAIHVLNVDERMRAAAQRRGTTGGSDAEPEAASVPEPISASEA